VARTHQPPSGLLDYLQPGLDILFVGINPGLKSAAVGHHFAGRSNRFWKLLFESRLVDEPLTYREDSRLLEWRLGLTNIISRTSAGIDALGPGEYRSGLTVLEWKIRQSNLGPLPCWVSRSSGFYSQKEAVRTLSILDPPTHDWLEFLCFSYQIPVDAMPTIPIKPCSGHFAHCVRQLVHSDDKSCYLQAPARVSLRNGLVAVPR